MVSPWKVYGPSTSTCCGSNRRDMSSECSGQCHRSKGLCKKVHPPGQFGESASIQCHVCVPPVLLKILPRSLFSKLYSMSFLKKILPNTCRNCRHSLFLMDLAVHVPHHRSFCHPTSGGPSGSWRLLYAATFLWKSMGSFLSRQSGSMFESEFSKNFRKRLGHQNIHESMRGVSLKRPPPKKNMTTLTTRLPTCYINLSHPASARWWETAMKASPAKISMREYAWYAFAIAPKRSVTNSACT